MHGPHGHSHALEARREDSRRRMWIALAINVVLLLAEVVGGLLTGSLAVLADAGHLLSDVGSIVLALIAARLAALPASGRRTFGYQRSEVLAALVNGLLLVAVSVGIAWSRRSAGSPTRRRSTAPACWRSASSASPATLAATWVLARGQREDINLEGVLRHSFADALGSLGVVLAGAFVLLGGSDIVDPIVGLLIAVLVLASSWRLIKEPFDVLMEAAPADLDVDAMGAAICREDGRALGPRPPRLDRDRRLRRPRRPRRRRPGLRPRPDPPPARADPGASGSGSSTRPCRWRRRPTRPCCRSRTRPSATRRAQRKPGCRCDEGLRADLALG